MEKKLGAIAIILIVLLAIRLIGQVLAAVSSFSDMVVLVISLILAILYLVSLIGVFKKQKWGAILVAIIAVIDLLSALIIGGAFGLGAGVVDLVLLALAYQEYKLVHL